MNKTISALAALALLVAVGAAYALWADVLKVKVEVNTGEVDVQFSPPTVTEYVGFPDGNGGWNFIEEGSTPEAKDVGQCVATLMELEDEEMGSISEAGNNDADLLINMTNAFPSYNCTVIFDVSNTGTIPVHLNFDVSGNPSGAHVYNTAPLRFHILNQDGAFVADCSTNMTGGYQLHAGESVYYTISCHVLQDAEELAKYGVQIYINATQFNES